GPVPSGVLREELADLLEGVRRHAADLFHHLRGVPGEVPLEHLEDTPRVLQRLIPLRVSRRQPGTAGPVCLAPARMAGPGPVLVLLIPLPGRGLYLQAF